LKCNLYFSWLASFESLLRLDEISLGVYLEQKEPVVITPSQQRLPNGEKTGNEEIKDIVKETLKPKLSQKRTRSCKNRR
jgi:hypothetical protein